MKNNKRKISIQIEAIADYAMKQGYVRYNPKDEIINFYLRKQGVVRRVRLDFENEKFIDVDNKCEVTVFNSGYILAMKKLFLKTGLPTYWKTADKSCLCKTRFVVYVSLLEELFDPSQWTVIKQCETQNSDGTWKIVPHDVPLNVDMSNRKIKNTIIQMYSVYGVPVKVLATMFRLSKRRIYEIVQKFKTQYDKVKKSRGLKKVGFERREN